MSWAPSLRKLCFAAIAADLLLKYGLKETSIVHYNQGALLGLAAGSSGGVSPVWLIASVVSLITIASLVWNRLWHEANRSAATALEFMLFGAVGNLLDRLLANPTTGAVTDYLRAGPLLLNLSDLILIFGFIWLVRECLQSSGTRVRSSNTRSG